MSGTASLSGSSGPKDVQVINAKLRGYGRHNSYVEGLATKWGEKEVEKEKEVLYNALSDVGLVASLGAVEVFRYRPKQGDLVWVDLWSATSALRSSSPHPSDQPTPVESVIPGTGLVGTLWSSVSRKSNKALRNDFSRRLSFDDSNRSLGADSKPTDIQVDVPPSTIYSKRTLKHMQSTLTTFETEAESNDQGVSSMPMLKWRDLATIRVDPDTWTCSRLTEHSYAKATGVPFDCDGVKGLVVYYTRSVESGSDEQMSQLLESIPMAAYLRRCASHVGYLLATRQARKACLALRASLELPDGPLDPDEESPNKEDQTSNNKVTEESTISKLNLRVIAWCNKCWGGGLQIPPPMPLPQVAWTLFGAFVGLLVLSTINEGVTNLTDDEYLLVIGPFGAMMTLLYALPSAPASQPRNVILGEAIAGGVSMTLSYLPLPKWIRRAVAPAFGIATMTALGVVHPPAGAHATIWADGDHNWYFYLIVVLCSAVSVIPATIVNNMSVQRQYPIYWGYLPKWLSEKIWKNLEKGKAKISIGYIYCMMVERCSNQGYSAKGRRARQRGGAPLAGARQRR